MKERKKGGRSKKYREGELRDGRREEGQKLGIGTFSSLMQKESSPMKEHRS